MRDRDRFLEKLMSLGAAREPHVVVTLVAAESSAPATVGAKAIFSGKGLDFGTIGGGKLEAKSLGHAMDLLEQRTNKPDLVRWNLKADVGMTCGGIVTLYFEPALVAPWNIVVFGAGHVSQALVPVLLTLDCQVTVVDEREEWLGRLLESPKLLALSQAPDLDPNLGSFFLCLTQGHSTDLPIVAGLLRRGQPRYLGVIGSGAKAVVLKRELRAMGFSPKVVEQIHCPVGLPLGNNSPAEIAISITAQLLQERSVPR